MSLPPEIAITTRYTLVMWARRNFCVDSVKELIEIAIPEARDYHFMGELGARPAPSEEGVS